MNRLWLCCLTLLFCTTCQTQNPRRDLPAVRTCLLVDSDGAFDDVRAMAWLMRITKLDMVVLTEGISRPKFAQNALETFWQRAKVAVKNRPPVFIGHESMRRLDASWLRVRERDERLNSSLTRPEAAKNIRKYGDGDFTGQLAGCEKIDLLVLGPYSSAAGYLPALKGRLGRVVVMGRRDERDFNCWYDRGACEGFFAEMGNLVDVVYVPDLDGESPQYKFETDDLQSFGKSEMASALATMFAADTNGWQPREMRMWDDLTVMFLFHPELFVKSGEQWVPHAQPKFFKRLWFSAFE